MTYPEQVSIVEVGPRDGLQNEAKLLPLANKIEWIKQLTQAGLQYIEVGSFVSPKWIYQMADTAALIPQLPVGSNTHYSVLIPNEKGLVRAKQAGAHHFAVFSACSETFTQKNINCSISESLTRFIPIANYAKKNNIPLRGYLSCAVACPFEGAIDPTFAASLAKALIDLGCYEISLGDTIGTATPNHIRNLIKACSKEVPLRQLALHCHDTYGQALANIYEGLQQGITTFDASNAGLGGCPYAPGASGNVATEDVLYLMHGLGIATGVDLATLIKAGQAVCKQLHVSNRSKVALAQG